MKEQLEHDKQLLCTLAGWIYMNKLYDDSSIKDRFNGMLGISDEITKIVSKIVDGKEYHKWASKEDNWESFIEQVGMCWDDYWLEQIKKEIGKTFYL
jgi:hypothetical protein